MFSDAEKFSEHYMFPMNPRTSFPHGSEIYFLISELQIQSPFYVYPIPPSLERRATRQTLPMIHRYSVQGSTGLVCCECYMSKWERERERACKREKRGGRWSLYSPSHSSILFPSSSSHTLAKTPNSETWRCRINRTSIFFLNEISHPWNIFSLKLKIYLIKGNLWHLKYVPISSS